MLTTHTNPTNRYQPTRQTWWQTPQMSQITAHTSKTKFWQLSASDGIRITTAKDATKLLKKNHTNGQKVMISQVSTLTSCTGEVL
jgi:hypothetical protein